VGISSVKRYRKMVQEKRSRWSKRKDRVILRREALGKKRNLDENGIKVLEVDLRVRPTITYEQRAEHDALDGALRPRGWGGVW
jgi:hypothetical protein